MMRAPRVIGWLLDERDRKVLLAIDGPAYAKTIAHHVTLKVGAQPSEKAPVAADPEVVGIADDGIGVQALVVRLGGTTERPDGGTYHITWSLAKGRKAKESNDVIARYGWMPRAPFAIKLTPARF
jgi:hypothetical protein